MAKAKMPARPAKQPLIDSDPKACVAKLTNRIAEVDAIGGFADPDDARFEIAQANIASDVRDIFGDDSIEFSKYEHHQIWRGGFSLHALPDHELVAARTGGLADTKTALQALVARVQERVAHAPAHAARDARAAFDNLSIHPRLLHACGKQFADGHYRDAILAAGIALVQYVKERSGSALDGTALMTSVFSVNNPILAFNDLKEQSDKDEQQGLMHLFAGAVLALRNPRAHSLTSDTADYAVEALSLISFLAKQLDTARKV